jgi:hypothetical protein
VTIKEILFFSPTTRMFGQSGHEFSRIFARTMVAWITATIWHPMFRTWMLVMGPYGDSRFREFA